MPHCKTGYKTCKDKFSVFSAPKDDDLLEKWRRAIPRKDRVLQPVDHVCERHFEPELVCKEWTAYYEGRVLMSAPRRATLVKDAVPTRFPDCAVHVSKTPSRKKPAQRSPKSRKRPAQRTRSVASKKSAPPSIQDPCVAKAGDSQSSGNCQFPGDRRSSRASPTVVSGNSADTTGEEQGCTVPSVKDEYPVFSSLFENIPCHLLPAKSWGVHRLELGDEKSVVFSELMSTQALPSDQSPGGAGLFSPFSALKVVQIVQKMEVRLFLMGKCVTMEQLNYSGELRTVEDVRSFLQHVDQIKLCAGGPSAAEQPQVKPKGAYIDADRRWRHNTCSFIAHSEASSCLKCLGLSDTLQTRQKGTLKRKWQLQSARFRRR